MTDELNDIELPEDELLEDKPEAVEKKQPEPELPKGYKTKEDLIAEGKDPSGWLPPEAFAERKERFKVETKYRRELEDMRNQMASLNKFHSRQLELTRSQLEKQREDAVLTADLKEVKRLDGELEDLKQAQPAQQVQKLPEEIEWEADNPWINDPDDPRTPVAQRIYVEQLKAGKTPATAMRAIDREIPKLFGDAPKVERRPAAPASDSSKTPAAKRGNDAPTVTWDSLSADEQAIYDSSVWPTKSEFLKSVANSRR